MIERIKNWLRRKIFGPQNIHLGYGYFTISDIYHPVEKWAGVSFSVSHPPIEVGEHMDVPDGMTTDDLDTVVIIRTQNIESLRTLVAKCELAVGHLESYQNEDRSRE